MGGFEGGDEGGYWDVDTPPNLLVNNPQNNKPDIKRSATGQSIKAHAKVTIFFKIIACEEPLPTLLSRVVQVADLYDTISFVPCQCDSFTIEGCDDIPLETNSIYKAYQALYDFTADSDIEEFFYEHKVVVDKRIALSAGLGGSASNAAAFMHLLKEVCNLVLSSDELAKIGSSIDVDLPFFIYNYPAANISGQGEIVEAFDEEMLKFKFFTPEIPCDKDLLYQTFKKELSKQTCASTFKDWEQLSSRNILKQISDPIIANDLYAAARLAYPHLDKDVQAGWFFSGCSFFKLLD